MTTMTRATVLATVAGLSVLLGGCGQADDDTPREASPVIAMLKAAKASDLDGFRSAYCRRIREDPEQGDWEKNLTQAQASLKRMYGEYQIKEFAFTFTGDEKKGKVAVSHQGKESIVLDVINEDGHWKINQR